ncbi:MAG: nucleotide exchange factor GrpE [Acetivibrionales bacterium]|jgi:molecular chaperone GrpE|nr:nucleotide exchange factor GrpE [Clostridiaceae bacterium]
MAKKSDVDPKKIVITDEDSDSLKKDVQESSESSQGEDLDKKNEDIDLNEIIKQKDAELKETVDRIQRLAAEFDNFRKRTQKEKERLYVDAVVDVVGQFLPVVDNLERAVTAAGQEESQGLQEGVNLILKQIIGVLEKMGVKPIEAVGTCFDPEIHNAVMHIEDDTLDCNIVTEEFQKGYIYKDEVVIRHSMVKVAN